MSGRVHWAAFGREGDLLAALDGCRRRGIAARDAYTPHPVHGLDERLGIRRSRLPLVCFAGGLAGLALGLAFQYWSSARSWPLDVGGKPFDSLPAFVPVAFELTVLLGGLATAGALLARSRLWPGRRAPAVTGATDDAYVLAVPERDAALRPGELPELLRGHGALRVWEEVEE